MASRTLDAGRYLGSVGSPVAAPGLVALASSYPVREPLPLHAHEHGHFCFVLEGAYTERIGRRETTRRAGRLTWYPAQLEHTERHHVPGRHLLLDLAPELLERSGAGGQALARTVELTGEHELELARRASLEVAAPGATSGLVLEGLALELVAAAARVRADGAAPCRPAWVRRVEEGLRERFREGLDLHALAGLAGVHPVHLSRTWRRLFGCTLGDTQRRLRIRFAAALLTHTDLPLGRIALEAGFADQAHLSRAFRRALDTTPGRFRRARGGGAPSL